MSSTNEILPSQVTKATIITIGDELLIGQVIDTNSAWIAQQLNLIGIQVTKRLAVGDVWEEIWQAIDAEMTVADILILTGGLGPTADDITKPLLCEYFKGKLVRHQPTYEHLQVLFDSVLKRPFTERNQLQALVPDTCDVLLNQVGTAPGMFFKKQQTWLFSLPGVPFEMKWLMQHEVLPMIQREFVGKCIQHKTLLTAGVGESFLADMVSNYEQQLPQQIKMAYLPNFGMVRLRLTCSGTHEQEVNQQITAAFEQLKEIVAPYLVADQDISLQQAVANLLSQQGATLATAESCTGGYIAHLFTAMSGASHYFKGGVVSYSNEIKESLLHVHNQTIEKEGAVSEATVKEMVIGAIEQFGSTYAVAVSGIMGPDGGSENKPVGMAWIAVANQKMIRTKQLFNRFAREKNIQITANHAINMLRMLIVDNR